MIEGRRIGGHAQAVHRQPQRSQHVEHHRLCVHCAHRPRGRQRMPRRVPGQQACGYYLLRIGREGRADLEQPGVGPAAGSVALGGLRQGGDWGGAQLVQVGCYGVQQPQGLRRVAERRCGPAVHEAERHALQQPGGGQGAPGQRRAGLARRQHGGRHGGQAGEGHGRDVVQAVQAQHFFHQVALGFHGGAALGGGGGLGGGQARGLVQHDGCCDVVAPGWDGERHRGLSAGLDGEAQALQRCHCGVGCDG